MDNSILISVIIPVYNVEEYLSKCLDSVAHQNMDPKKYEVIIVNDGSTDSSISIINKFVKYNDNFYVINQEHRYP